MRKAVAAHPVPPFTQRTAAVALVVAAHCIALLLLSLKRPAGVITETEPPLLWTFIRPGPVAPTEAGSKHPARSRQRRIPSHAEKPAAAKEGPPIRSSARIDWAEEARSTAIHEIELDAQERRRAKALLPPGNPLFSNRVPGPTFHWYRAGTNRIEPLKAGGLALNLSDECVLVFTALILIPACTLEKAPARSDLFDHMHAAPEPRSRENQ